MSEVHNKKVIVIVDAYTGGKYLVPAFQAIGYKVIHIESPFTPSYFNQDQEFTRRTCDRTIIYNFSYGELLETLNEYSIKAIIAGSEGAVELADTLNNEFELPFSNDIELSMARRDKYAMQEAIKKAGVASIDQAMVTSTSELSDWLAGRDDWPVVLKPLKSAATDGVSICHSESQALDAFHNIMGKNDVFGAPNTSVLCQEFLEGAEYVVNGIARDNGFFFTDLFESRKRFVDGNPIYDEQILRYVNDECYHELSDYTQVACQALGLRNGAFHAEVMLTKRGPVLIEVGARIAGGADPYIIEETLGHSQVSKLVDAIVRPEVFDGSIHQLQSRNTISHKKAAYVYMLSPKSGCVLEDPLPALKNIKGVVSAKYHYDIGDIQNKTIDLLTAPGAITVIEKDSQTLFETIAKVRETEQTFYDKGLGEVSKTPETGRDLASLVRDTIQTFPWYGEINQVDINRPFTISDLPLIDEAVLTEHYYHADHQFESMDIYLTSGTTSGKRKRISYVPSDQDIYLQQRKDIIQNFCGNSYKTACADLGTGHAAATAGEIFRLMGCETELIDFTRPIAEHIKVLNRINPEIFFTMPMILDALIATGELKATPKKIIVVGDVASLDWQKKVALFFGIRVNDILDLFGSIEIGSIAFFNHEIGKYQFDDYILPEVIDANTLYSEVSYNGPGEVLLLTSFARSSFPAVRFVTNDLIEGFDHIEHKGKTIYVFDRCLGRYSGEFKHGEKVNLSDITAAIAKHAPYKAYDLDDTKGALVIRIADPDLNQSQIDSIKKELMERNPDIAEMILSGLVGDIEVVCVSESEIRCAVSKRRYKS
ncbi:ATP-grasp domain-containing protein [Vibrio caribbeanicus]|uniref:Coenzyme F390 synthetase-like protein n=1 Tax=Vibrio caribbeanicus ATCC BAA-2122 TaxID=796620 RepID=E3BG36_9VIBR|nr:ATP-grasp domain-containing protein [Vibrio caribbeanicus]EFP97961.1 coenzyme F390 synthetase-like protein [Vibrio caribbeanicus ATCC BAA-2122]